jgi:hypothetical protein
VVGGVAPDQTLIEQHGVSHCRNWSRVIGPCSVRTARQPDLGTYLWRSPEGLIALTTNQGTLLLGDRHWAHRVWTTAGPDLSRTW